MHLISSLSVGVRGAIHGTVFVYERGTDKPAPVYADASGKIRRHGALRLDALCAISLYVDRLVDVFVYDKSMTLVRRWTDGKSAGAVVVESPAFTGVDYETGVSAVGERTTLIEALNRWLPSAGATDFNMLSKGAVRPVQAVIGDTIGHFFDVRSFGAHGDGTGDDTAAIQTAIDTARAAGGGLVYLRPGRYRITESISLPEEVSILGDNSASASIVISNHLVPALVAFGTDSPAPVHSISGISFSCEPTGATTSEQPLVHMLNGSVLMTDCTLNGDLNIGPLVLVEALQKARITGCIFRVMSPTSAGLSTFVPGATTSAKRVHVENCSFVVLGTRDISTGIVGTSQMHLDGCTFDLKGITSGDAECISLSGVVNGMVDGCEMTNIGGGGVATLLSAVTLNELVERLFEDCSMINSPDRLYRLAVSSADAPYYSRLKTVVSRVSPPVEDLVATNTGLIHPIATDASQYGVFSVYNKSAVINPPASESGVVVGAANTTDFSDTVNLGRAIDILYFCAHQDGFNINDNRARNSVVPRWNFRDNTLFAFRLISSRLPGTTPVTGDTTRLHCLNCSGSTALIVTTEREGYGPI